MKTLEELKKQFEEAKKEWQSKCEDQDSLIDSAIERYKECDIAVSELIELLLEYEEVGNREWKKMDAIEKDIYRIQRKEQTEVELYREKIKEKIKYKYPADSCCNCVYLKTVEDVLTCSACSVGGMFIIQQDAVCKKHSSSIIDIERISDLSRDQVYEFPLCSEDDED